MQHYSLLSDGVETGGYGIFGLMEIVPGTITDLDALMAMIRDIVQHMNANGIDQWHPEYPNPEVISRDLNSGTLHCLKVNGAFAGMIVVNEEYDEEYSAMQWLTPPNSSLYVHRLAVHPSHQRKGFGRLMMDFAEAKAEEEGYRSVRLDTYTGNPGNVRLYEKLGYTTIGKLHLPYRPELFVCYEKLVG